MGLIFISNKNRYEIRFHKDNNIEQSAHSFDTQAKALAHFRNIQITDRDFCADYAGGLVEVYDNLNDCSIDCKNI